MKIGGPLAAWCLWVALAARALGAHAHDLRSISLRRSELQRTLADSRHRRKSEAHTRRALEALEAARREASEALAAVGVRAHEASDAFEALEAAAREAAEAPEPRLPLVPYPKSVQRAAAGARPFLLLAATREAAEAPEPRLPLVPYPKSVQRAAAGARPFLLLAATRVLARGFPEGDLSVRLLREHIREASGRGGAGGTAPAGAIELELGGEGGAESYTLDVSAQGVKVRAPALAGIFYAVQTLRQLTPSEGEPALPAVAIRDEPRLQWRGLMMDVSRHFFNAAEVKRMLDTMSLFKFNHFHWHLTDDQGWRLPVKGYPKLTELGATGPDGKVRAYTEADIRDVVAYAAERHIMVLPEVDVPGHSAAAIASYPELGNDDMPGFRPPHEPVSTWGMFHFTLGPSGNSSRFLRSVFNEVSELFPGPFVHIGGDEAPTDQWDRSPRARKVLREQSLYHVQSHFNEELSTILKGRNKTVVAWDEAQHMPGLHPDAVVLAWRSIDELKRAVRGGRRCVNADVSTLYFDRYQGPQGKEPKANCCYTPLAQVYRYDPIPAGLHQDEERLVMGAQAQLWAEYDPTFKQVEYQAFPRALALAERLWTPREEVVSFEEFMGRLRPRVEADLGRRGVNYRRIQGDEER